MRKPSSKAASPKKVSKSAAAVPEYDGERHRRIADLAYSIGARRGFSGGTDEAREDWLQAEKLIDAEDAKPS